jgi:hypothetical protein
LVGRGTRVRSVTLDGAELPSRTVPPSLSGHHVVVVELGDRR